MKIESAVTRVLLSTPYPDQYSVYLIYSRYNLKELFSRARKTVIDIAKNFEISYKERYIFSNKVRLYFIDDIEYQIHGTELEGFWFDEPEFVRSRTFMYRVRPQLHYRYGTSIKVE